MLDQNTDRMWYVIGAVLVGAAIILIANGTIPEIFASVAGSFEEVSSNVSEDVSMIRPRKEVPEYIAGPNILESRDAVEFFKVTADFPTGNMLEQMTVYTTNGDQNIYTGGIRLRQSNLNLDPSTNYVLSYEYQKVEGALTHFGGHNTEGYGRYDSPTYVDGFYNHSNYYDNRSAYVGDDGKRHTVEVFFTTGEELTPILDVWVQPNRGQYSNVTTNIYNLALREVVG